MSKQTVPGGTNESSCTSIRSPVTVTRGLCGVQVLGDHPLNLIFTAPPSGVHSTNVSCDRAGAAQRHS
ncbi:MAG: hypothetical protein IT436_15820 [Phycisphaerales bacterium]|nr:hypothetical protein [Phycisphaerales bacterium]